MAAEAYSEKTGLAMNHEVMTICNGLLAGAVSISGVCHNVTVLSACFIGAIASIIYVSSR